MFPNADKPCPRWACRLLIVPTVHKAFTMFSSILQTLRRGLATSLLLSLTLGAGLATAAGPAEMIVTPFETLKFSPKKPGEPQISPVRGNPEREASSIVMKMGRGAFPMHTHTANYQFVVVKGVMKHWDASGSQKTAPRMTPGSYWYQPANQPHADACESDECVWFISFDGVRDFAEAKGH